MEIFQDSNLLPFPAWKYIRIQDTFLFISTFKSKVAVLENSRYWFTLKDNSADIFWRKSYQFYQNQGNQKFI